MKATALIGKGKDGTCGIFTSDLKSTIIDDGNSIYSNIPDFSDIKPLI